MRMDGPALLERAGRRRQPQHRRLDHRLAPVPAHGGDRLAPRDDARGRARGASRWPRPSTSGLATTAIGSLEAGKDADLVDPRRAIRSAPTPRVLETWVEGRRRSTTRRTRSTRSTTSAAGRFTSRRGGCDTFDEGCSRNEGRAVAPDVVSVAGSGLRSGCCRCSCRRLLFGGLAFRRARPRRAGEAWCYTVSSRCRSRTASC